MDLMAAVTPLRLNKTSPLPFFIFVIGLVSTFCVWQFTDKNLDQRAKARFDNQRKSIQLRIQKRLDLYVSALYGVKAFFAASQEVNRAEWAAFMKSQAILNRYPSLLAIKYVERITAEEKEGFVSRVRSDTTSHYGGYPDFSIYPNQDRPEAYVVNYLYPFEENKMLFGLDMSSDPVYWEVMEEARDKNESAFTPKLTLRPQSQVGFLIFMPVYRNHLPVKTIQDRRLALKGFIVSAVSADRLFRDLYDDYAGYKNIDFEIFDGDILSKENLLYDSNDSFSMDDPGAKARFGVSVPLNVQGRTWTLRFTALSEFQLDDNERNIKALVFISGFLFSLLISGILYFQGTSRLRAVRLAEEMTVDLRREVEERKKMQEELYKLSQVQSEFTSTVSHELRTPLSVINESISMIEDGTVGKINEGQRDLIETAKKNVDRLSRLINAVLDYQKLDSHSMKFHATENDVNVFVKEVVKGFMPVARSKGLELGLELGSPLPKALFDKDLMTQVLMNLIHNAIKFTEKGKITVQTVSAGEQGVRISVKDEGSGIRKEELTKLFKSFSQTAEGHRKTGGTGLGLAISKKIVEAHKGSIGVESIFGKGSHFYFILPTHP